MSTDSPRLERLLSERLEGCGAADVEARVAELEGLTDEIPSGTDTDLAALSTLSDGTRYRIARLLDAAEGDLCVCEVEPLVDVSDSAVSHALSDLADAGLVTRRKAGTWRYYDATERTSRLLDALDATRGGTDD